jgi:hypothetical protein
MAQGSITEDLIADAKLVAGYGQRAGLFEDDLLFVAIAKVERLTLEDRTLGRDEFVELQREFNRSRKIVSFPVFAALRNGWSPLVVSRALSASVVLCVLLSILLMTIVGRLTFVYNQGSTLMGDLQLLESQGYDRRFGQLERRLVSASVQAHPAAEASAGSAALLPSLGAEQAMAATGTNVQENVEQMAVDNYYDMLSEIKTLDRTIDDIGLRSQRYLLSAIYPLPLMQAAHLKLASLFGGENYSDVPPPGAKPDVAALMRVASARVGVHSQPVAAPPTNPSFVNANCLRAEDQALVGALPGDEQSALGHSIRQDIVRSFQFACANGLRYTSAYMPPLEQWKGLIRDRLNPYLFWILPGLYGALGAMLYFMRSILDPLMPNPRWVRIIHRMALGALAGIIVAWFWQPLGGEGGDLSNLGFGPFTFAFVAGFSMDIFFALLDRLVAVSVAGIGKLGQSA